MEFVAIDVETANSDRSSICQVGLVTFRDGVRVASWSSYINPRAVFDPVNVEVHGITRSMVRDAPTWPDVIAEVRSLCAVSFVASHTSFDKVAIDQACEEHDLPLFDCRWLDTARVVRRAWPERFARRGYGLAEVAEFLGVEFRHHDALEDARAAGEVLCAVVARTGIGFEEWLKRSNQSMSDGAALRRSGDPEGGLSGNVIVFTGSLSMTRRDAGALAARAGCEVAPDVTRKTTLLVVGDQDDWRLEGNAKSAKHLKAEALIAKGQSIRILSESDFRRLVDEPVAPGGAK